MRKRWRLVGARCTFLQTENRSQRRPRAVGAFIWLLWDQGVSVRTNQLSGPHIKRRYLRLKPISKRRNNEAKTARQTGIVDKRNQGIAGPSTAPRQRNQHSINFRPKSNKVDSPTWRDHVLGAPSDPSSPFAPPPTVKKIRCTSILALCPTSRRPPQRRHRRAASWPSRAHAGALDVPTSSDTTVAIPSPPSPS